MLLCTVFVKKYFKMELIKNYENALQAIYDHVGFKEDWVIAPIDDCDLSIRTKNICRMNDFKVIRDLIAYSTKDLMMLHFGKRTISEIQEFLFSKWYYFGS